MEAKYLGHISEISKGIITKVYVDPCIAKYIVKLISNDLRKQNLSYFAET